jgi:hypothetical protein
MESKSIVAARAGTMLATKVHAKIATHVPRKRLIVETPQSEGLREAVSRGGE